MFLSSIPDSNKKNAKKTAYKSYKDTLTPSTFFSKNEIHISQRIISIPRYSNYFSPIIKNSLVTVAKIDSNKFETCEILTAETRRNQYILVTKVDTPNKLSFSEVFYTSTQSGKTILYNIITSYRHLLQAIELLDQAKIVHMNLHPSNLQYCKNLPVIQHLSQCFHIPSINAERINYLFSYYQEKNVFLPVEAHVICFLTQHQLATLSFLNVDSLAEDYYLRLDSLSCFTESFINEYKETTRLSLQSYVNVPRESIFSLMFATSNTWNTYSISVLFLVLLRDAFKKVGVPKNFFISAFYKQLTQNIHPLPEKRIDCKQNSIVFNELVYKTTINEFNEIGSLSLFDRKEK